MALDMDQLRGIFQEECRDNLQLIEQELLAFDCESPDAETINTIFRAAHSIKGGAGTFDYHYISDFTHLVETLLDEARNGKRQLDRGSIDLLLKANDFTEQMLSNYESDTEIDLSNMAQLTLELQSLLKSESLGTLDGDENRELQKQNTELQEHGEWEIHFAPHEDLFFSGNDPARIIKELTSLASESNVICQINEVPDFAQLEPQSCFLSWIIKLDESVSESDIKEVFEWVEDECDLSIKRILHGHTQDEEHIEVTTTETQQVSKPAAPQNPRSGFSIRVDIEKVDHLINLVGELVITQSMINELSHDFDMSKLEPLQSGIEQLLQNTREIQDSVLNIRMLPVSFAFNRFPRLIRDLAPKLGKEIQLDIEGENTELDKTVLEKITDPLVHLIRNAVDHGVETPDARKQKGKSPQGRVALKASHQGGNVVIEIQDDGAGINPSVIFDKAINKGLLPPHTQRHEMSDDQIFQLIFMPGFSTADVVSDLSGRGVGMDVVKKNIESLGGAIAVESYIDAGSRFTITLPLTLSILDGQLVNVCGQIYVIPLISIVESIQVEQGKINIAAGGQELYQLRDQNLPIVRLHHEFDLSSNKRIEDGLLCFVEANGQKVGLLLDDLLGQQQVVIKSLESNFRKVHGISGATILGDGSVSLILDIQSLISTSMKSSVTEHEAPHVIEGVSCES
ncbi:chemotaxis protein CheA [Vibrio sp. V39_P1S14PM300]|uniref:chemotaxis protein CheA n=1 Tax=Vibrio sp. V39_P1S14PM300 TaxID=1938690 RepID=UPI0013726FFD|nr:chemotaxis protein CheA [Vibrio sp. V39_P1S14PM300]NAX20941.1 chemotaxis protein CheA [Vibrio sp. V39_P1S14PM300]